MTEPHRIGVAPAVELSHRARLLAALAEAYPVRFVPFGEDAAAVVSFGSPPETTLPTLAMLADERTEAGEPEPIALAEGARLARPLRGALLTDRHLPHLEPARDTSAPSGRSAPRPPDDASPAALRGEPFAHVDGRPIWTSVDDRLQLAAAAPQELAQSEALRDRLAPGRNAALLPLAHFLANLTANRRWQPGPLRAAIILDDPNLHWPTYGRVRYGELVEHAREHDYHVSMAMVPLDAWLAHPRVARLFATASDCLSLSIHGNDHTGPELGRPRSEAEGSALATEALRRMARLEQRSGIAVSRVMVPPHERVSEAAAQALRACDYDALCTTRPYPWMVTKLRAPWLTRPAEAGPLAGWHSVDVVAGGLPVLLRSAFGHPREDIVLRAFLGQPLILYGHHDDLDSNLDLLAEAAADVNRVGEVNWCSVGDVARGAVETRRDGDTLHVRPRARRVRIEVPDGVSGLAVDPSVLELPHDAPLRTGRGSVDGMTVELDAAGPIDLEVGAPTGAPATPRIPLHRRAWPLARRWASEVRDRVEPLRAA